MADLNNFERVIKEDRAARESKQWRGTLLEYLEVVKADPIMTKLAHARIYDLIISIGLHPLADTDDPRTKRLFSAISADGPPISGEIVRWTLISSRGSGLFFSMK